MKSRHTRSSRRPAGGPESIRAHSAQDFRAGRGPLALVTLWWLMLSTRPAGPMARRLTTNQEIAGSTPASVNLFFFFFAISLCLFVVFFFFFFFLFFFFKKASLNDRASIMKVLLYPHGRHGHRPVHT